MWPLIEKWYFSIHWNKRMFLSQDVGQLEQLANSGLYSINEWQQQRKIETLEKVGTIDNIPSLGRPLSLADSGRPMERRCPNTDNLLIRNSFIRLIYGMFTLLFLAGAPLAKWHLSKWQSSARNGKLFCFMAAPDYVEDFMTSCQVCGTRVAFCDV